MAPSRLHLPWFTEDGPCQRKTTGGAEAAAYAHGPRSIADSLLREHIPDHRPNERTSETQEKCREKGYSWQPWPNGVRKLFFAEPAAPACEFFRGERIIAVRAFGQNVRRQVRGQSGRCGLDACGLWCMGGRLFLNSIRFGHLPFSTNDRAIQRVLPPPTATLAEDSIDASLDSFLPWGRLFRPVQ
jgi:hypothetical protein